MYAQTRADTDLLKVRSEAVHILVVREQSVRLRSVKIVVPDAQQS